MYNNIENKGYTTSRTDKILFLLKKYNNTGLTARELAYNLHFKERNATHPRLNILVRKGQVIVIGKKKDKTTKRLVSIYKINPNYEKELM